MTNLRLLVDFGYCNLRTKLCFSFWCLERGTATITTEKPAEQTAEPPGFWRAKLPQKYATRREIKKSSGRSPTLARKILGARAFSFRSAVVRKIKRHLTLALITQRSLYLHSALEKECDLLFLCLACLPRIKKGLLNTPIEVQLPTNVLNEGAS